LAAGWPNRYKGGRIVQESLDTRCPNCGEEYYKGYQKGCADTFEILRKELTLARLRRPVIIKLEEESIIIKLEEESIGKRRHE